MGFWRNVVNIFDGKYPRTSKKYPTAHRKASELEKRKFGKIEFKKLTKLIQKRIPKGQLAASHPKRGVGLISKRIPRHFWREEKFHEVTEKRLMRGEKITKVSGFGRDMKIKWSK